MSTALTPTGLGIVPLVSNGGLALLWLFVFAGCGLALRPPRARRRPVAMADPTRSLPSARSGPMAHLGEWVLAIDPIQRRAAGRLDGAEREVGFGALAVLAAVLLIPIDTRATAVVAVGVPALLVLRRRRRSSDREAGVTHELPEIIDLLSVAVAGGLTVPLAIDAVARRVPGQIAAAFGEALSRSRLGSRLADELEQLPDNLGDAIRPLIRALVAAERYGSPIADALIRVADAGRADRRRAAETAARRLPIKLLFPLVVCVLPAFVLLTVTPVVVASLSAIRG